MFRFIIFRCAYYGGKYKGFQIQPNVPTIQGELRKALSLSTLEDSFKYVSRTDAGVSAVDQIVLLRLRDKPVEDLGHTILSINQFLPSDIKIYAYATTNFFSFKDILYKEYLYLIPRHIPIDTKTFSLAVDYINNNKRNYFYLIKHPTSEITAYWLIYKLQYNYNKNFIYLRIQGKRFFWEQIRRLVSLLVSVATHRISLDTYRRILNGEKYRCGIPPAPAIGLILWKIKTSYDDNFVYLEPRTKIEEWLLTTIGDNIKESRWNYPCREK